jgi:flagellar hook-basal body protein
VWDLTVCGEGFLELEGQDGHAALARSGSFAFDAQGVVRDESGQALMGQLLDDAGVIQPGRVKAVHLPVALQPRPTTFVKVVMKIDGSSDIVSPRNITAPPIDFADPSTYNYAVSLSVYDLMGQRVTLTLFIQKVTDNGWNVFATANGMPVNGTDADPKPINTTPFGFRPDGSGPTTDLSALRVSRAATPDLPPLDFTLSLADTTLHGEHWEITGASQDGHSAGQLAGMSIRQDGTVTAHYDNAQGVAMAKIALVHVAMPLQLDPVGPGLWRPNARTGTVTRTPAISARSCGLQFNVLQLPGTEPTAGFASARFGVYAVTGRTLDAAICGHGFFELSTEDGERRYSRDGRLFVGADAVVRNEAGLALVGRLAKADGGLATGPETPLRLDPTLLSTLPARATRHVTVSGNLDPASDVIDTTPAPDWTAVVVSTSPFNAWTGVDIYDEGGRLSWLMIAVQKVAANRWNVFGILNGTPLKGTPDSFLPLTALPLEFLADGSLRDPDAAKVQLDVALPSPDDPLTLTRMSVEISLAGLTQKPIAQDAPWSRIHVEQDGSPRTRPVALQLDSDGALHQIYDYRPRSRLLAKITLANFEQPGALTGAGPGLWAPTSAAGPVSRSLPASRSNCGLQVGVRQQPVELAPDRTPGPQTR